MNPWETEWPLRFNLEISALVYTEGKPPEPESLPPPSSTSGGTPMEVAPDGEVAKKKSKTLNYDFFVKRTALPPNKHVEYPPSQFYGFELIDELEIGSLIEFLEHLPKALSNALKSRYGSPPPDGGEDTFYNMSKFLAEMRDRQYEETTHRRAPAVRWRSSNGIKPTRAIKIIANRESSEIGGWARGAPISLEEQRQAIEDLEVPPDQVLQDDLAGRLSNLVACVKFLEKVVIEEPNDKAKHKRYVRRVLDLSDELLVDCRLIKDVINPAMRHMWDNPRNTDGGFDKILSDRFQEFYDTTFKLRTPLMAQFETLI